MQLIEAWSETPALVESRYTDVLAANRLMLALAPYYAVGTNRVRAIFFDPRVRDMYEDWEPVTERAVAELRALGGPTSTIPASTSWSASSRSAASGSAGSGRGTTPARSAAARRGSVTHSSARWN